MAMHKKILYLRTDICTSQIICGGSVGHTLGVIHGFLEQGYEVIVFSSQMQQILQNKYQKLFIVLRVFPIFYVMRWKISYLRWRLECLFSNISFTLQIFWYVKKRKLANHEFMFMYARYSVMNCTGVLLQWLLSIPLVLEYNGSEAYWFDIPDADVWYRRWFRFRWLSYHIEHVNCTYAHIIVVVSQALKDDLVMRGIAKSKILVNPNGVDSEKFSQLFTRASATNLEI